MFPSRVDYKLPCILKEGVDTSPHNFSPLACTCICGIYRVLILEVTLVTLFYLTIGKVGYTPLF